MQRFLFCPHTLPFTIFRPSSSFLNRHPRARGDPAPVKGLLLNQHPRHPRARGDPAFWLLTHNALRHQRLLYGFPRSRE